MTPRRVIPILALLCALSAPTTADTPVERVPEWVLGDESPAIGDLVELWLIVPTPTGWMGGDIEVSLSAPLPQEAWFRAETQTCAEASASRITVLRASLPSDEVVRACVRIEDRRSGRLLGSVIYRPAGGSPTMRIAASPHITVRSSFELGPTGLALLSAAMGFLAGLLTQVFQVWREDQKNKRAAKHEMGQVVAKALVSEMTGNRRKLHDYLGSPAGTAAQTLDTGGYNGLFGQKGVLGYLSARERADYLDALDALYANDIAQYNRVVTRNPLDPALRPAAHALEIRLGAFMP